MTKIKPALINNIYIYFRAYDSMIILSDVSLDILARNKCSLLTYLLTYIYIYIYTTNKKLYRLSPIHSIL